MPVYEYRCENGHTFDVLQRMSDDPVAECAVCGAPVQRVFHPVAVHFKGSGFYTTDYGKRGRGGAGASSDGGESSSGTTESSEAKKPKSDSKPPKSDAKSAA